MEKEEFSKKWRRLKTSEERRQILFEELKNEFGSFDAFQNRLPTLRNNRSQAYVSVDEFPFMKYNNLHAQQTEYAMFGDRIKAENRDNKKTIVNKIVEEMTNIPAFIEDFTASTSHLVKNQENGTSKTQKSPIGYNEYKRLKQHGNSSSTSNSNSKSDQSQNNRIHSNSKSSTSNNSRLDAKPQRSPVDQKQTNNRQHSPTNNKRRADTPLDNGKHKKLNSTNASNTSNIQIPKIELSTISPSTSQPSTSQPSTSNNRIPPEIHSRPSSANRTEFFICKFPSYAIGEYVGYRIRKSAAGKSIDLPNSIVSINVRKMPSVKEIMVQVKQCILRTSKLNKIKENDLICALYLCGLMLYAVYKSRPSDVNDLLREVLSILSTIRSTFLSDNPQCRQLKNYSIVFNMLHLADSHLCERLYENTLESALKRRQLLDECRGAFSTFDTNEELIPANFGSLLDDKEQFTNTLADLCSKDKVNIPKLYYQLLMENSQHSMLHERHVYSKRLAIQQMENTEPALWKRLTKDMKFQLNQNSCTDIADSIFSLVHWMSSQ